MFKKLFIKNCFYCIFFIVFSFNFGWSQTTVFSDNFNRGAVVSPIATGGNPSATYTNTSSSTGVGPGAISRTTLNNPLESATGDYSTILLSGGSSTITIAGTWDLGATSVTLASSNVLVMVGQTVTGTGIAASTTVAAIAGTLLTLSAPTTAAGSAVSLVFTIGTQTAGTTYMSSSFPTNVIFNPILNSNTSDIEWDFNVKTNRSSFPLSGFASGSYGGGIVLAASSGALNTAGTNGYAIILEKQTTAVGALVLLNTTVTLTAPNTGIFVGQMVTGTGIPANTTVVSITGATLVLSAAPTTANAARTLTFSLIGTGSTTTASNQIVLTASNPKIIVGQAITGIGIPTSSYITAINGATLTINNVATATAASGIVFTIGGGTTIKLIKFTGGLQLGTRVPLITPLTEIFVEGATPNKNNFASVKVVFTPSTNTWQMFLRDDASSTVPNTDFSTGLVSVGSIIDNTYTTSASTSFGFLWNHSTGTSYADNCILVDNFKFIVNNPTINAPYSLALSGFTATASSPSSPQSFNVSGQYLTNSIVVSPSTTDYEICTTQNGTYSSSITLTNVVSVSSTSIYIRLKSGLTDGTKTGTCTITSVGATTTSGYLVTLNGIVSSAPLLTSSISIIPAFANTAAGLSSVAQTFSISGINLNSGNVTLTAPTNFTISTNGTNYFSTVSVTPVGGNVGATIYVKYSPTGIGASTGNIILSWTGLANQSIAVNGSIGLYYYQSGSLTNLNNWNALANGTGTVAPNFTNNGITYQILTSTTTDAPFAFSGTGSKIVVGNATTTGVVLTIASGFGINGTIDISDGNKVFVQDIVSSTADGGITYTYSMNSPVFGSLSPNSEVHYQNNTSNIAFISVPYSYGKLFIDGNGSGSVNFSVSGNLVIQTSLLVDTNAKMGTSATSTNYFTINSGGTVTINGTLYVSKAKGLIVSGVYGNLGGAIQFLGAENLIFGSSSTIEYNKPTNATIYYISPISYVNLTVSGLDNPKGFTATTNVSGTFTINMVGTTSVLSGCNFLTLGNNATIVRTSGGLNLAPTFGTSVNVSYNGIAAQTASFEIPTSNTVLNNLIINNASGVTLSANTSVNGTLTFTSGKLITGINSLTLGTSASISGAGLATGWVVGSLIKQIATNVSPTFAYAIGDATNYTPISLTFTGNNTATTAGSITASTTSGDHIQVATSGIDAANSINRTWTIVNSGVTGFTNYNATLNYVATDNDSSATPSNFVIRKYDGTSWFAPVTVATPSATSATANGFIDFGDFAVGTSTGTPAITAQPISSSICVGGDTTFTASATSTLATTSQWQRSTNGSLWTNITAGLDSGTTYSGFTTGTLTLTGSVAGLNNYQYRAVFTSINGTSNSTAVILTVNTTTAPIASAQSFCNSGTVAGLTATGTGLNWYSTSTSGTPLTSTTALVSGTYYVSQTLSACESPRASVVVTLNTTAAPTASAQSFCNSGTVAGLTATGTGLNWYSTSTSGTPLTSTTALVSGTYYVSQTLSACESPRASVVVTLNTTAAPTASAQSFCNSGTVAGLTATGTGLNWYSTSTSGTPLTSTTALVSGTYYVSQTLSACESPRASVVVTLNTTAAPTASAQSFCNSGTVAGLTAIGTGLNWYATSTSGTPLTSTTALASGTYYVSQTLSACESPRASVVVTLNTTAAPTASAQSFCNSGTVAGLTAIGTGLNWYATSTSVTALTSTTALISGTYYVSQTINSCQGPRASVAVTLNTIAAPTGAATQSLSSLLTVGSIVVAGTNVVWYSNSANATAGTNPLPNTTLLSNTTYYATQTIGGCTSVASLAVTITTLGNQDFDMTAFSYYPNPVNSILNIFYSQELTNVKVFSMLGQQLLAKEVNANNTQIDLSSYANGVYFIQVATESATKTIRVIKR